MDFAKENSCFKLAEKAGLCRTEGGNAGNV
jgi:hypothetical protein